MITKRRIILVVENNKQLIFLKNFEALEEALEMSMFEKIFSNNKTPVITKEVAHSITAENMVVVPNMLLGIDKTEEFTEFCHAHEFECGEYRTGQVFDTKDERCFMCEIANHRGFANPRLYNQYVDKTVDIIIYESPNFYVISELGSLKQGYLMIVPRKHILSVAQFPTEYRNEYQEVCSDLEDILLNTFDGSTVSFMEHGSGPSGLTSHKKSIVHAHTHVVVDFWLKSKYKKMVQLRPCNDVSIAKDIHYFSYQEGSMGQLMISMNPDVYVQRQFPRQVMAEELGLAPEQYNWRCYDFDEITDATLFHLFNYLKEEKEGRIYERTRAFVEGFSARKRKKEE